VVVTGAGVVSPLGHRVSSYVSGLVAGRSALAPPTIPRADLLSTRVVAEVAGFDPTSHFSDREMMQMDRVAQFAVVAAREAVTQSGLTFDEALAERTATIVGTGVGGQNTQDDSYYRVYAEQSRRLHPLTVPRLMVSAAPSHVSMQFGLRGPAFAIASACASGAHAVGLAFQMLRAGTIDCAVTGGTDACITFGTLRAWEALRIMAPDACRPFSRDRKGLVLGEGAAILVLEPLERARARGAEILGEIVGFGMTSDAKELVAPDELGAARAIAAALQDARMSPGDIDYINAHGTGTVINDIVETCAIKRVFGDHAGNVPISATKSMIGHALGAAGALELVATLHTVATGIVPPTINYLGPDPACDLDYVCNEARRAPIRTAVSNSFAFGGLNAVLVVQRFDG
jgi:nodulation protein E